MTSLYLDVDGRRSPRWSDVEPRIDHLFRAARHQRLAAAGTEKGAEADLAVIRTWLDRPLDRTATRGIAVFSHAAKGLFEAVQLPVPVHDQVAVDRCPDVAQLCLALVTSRSAITVALDRERWRMVRLAPDGEADELDVLDDRLPHRVDIDIELAGFDRHEEEFAREHYRRVARRLVAELERSPATSVVLCGPTDAVSRLEADLPDHVAARVAGRISLPTAAATDELARATHEVLDRADEERRSTVLDELRSRVSTGTQAVNGLDATLDALGARQVATLVVERTFKASGGRCDDCGLLVATVKPCPRCNGHVHAVDNVVDAAIADAYLHDVALEPVKEGTLSDLGRIGALLPGWARTTAGGPSGA